MSDDINEDQAQAERAETDQRLQQKRDSLAKAREVHRQNREAAASRESGGIEIEPPTAPQGERGDRADVAREETLGPEVTTRREERELTLSRRSRFERDVDGIYFPERLKKPGWDYQFVTVRVMNQDQGRVDESELVAWEDQGWRPCLARDYPDLAGRGVPPDRPIEMRGSRAYERPKHLSLQAAEEDRVFAEQQRVDRTRAAATGGLGDGIPGDRRGLVRVPDGVRVEGGVWRK